MRIIFIAFAALLFAFACRASRHSFLLDETTTAFPSSSNTAIDAHDGKSLIERLILRHGTPRTLADLKNSIAAESGIVSTALFPRGRSLQKDKVSLMQPRVVGAVTSMNSHTWPNLDLENKLFFGFAEAPQQMEVISWTPSRQEFEFFLITEMGSENPKLVKEDPNVCLPCHQNGGPLFTPAPWPESNLLSGATRTALLAAHAGRASYLGTEIDTGGNGTGFGIQAAVVDASEKLVVGRQCRKICGSDLECRKAVLKNAISYRGAFGGISPLHVGGWVGLELIEAKAKENLGENETSFLSSGLPIFSSKEESGRFANIFLIPSSSGDNDQEQAIKSASIDPKEMRPRIQAKFFGSLFLKAARQCFGFTAFEEELFKQRMREEWFKLVDSSAVVNLLTDQFPPPAPTVMKTLLLAAGVPESQIPGIYFTTAISAGSSGASGQATVPAEPVARFRHFCGKCHAGGDAIAGELPLDSLTALAAYRSDAYDQTLIQLVEESVMPPIPEAVASNIGLTKDVRKALVEVLKASVHATP